MTDIHAHQPYTTRPRTPQLAYLLVHEPMHCNLAPLVPLNRSGSEPYLFCLPGIDGHLLNFRHLSQCVHDQQPVYGLQPHGLAPGSQPLTSIEAIAERHIAEIQKLQPPGPFRPAGYSFG